MKPIKTFIDLLPMFLGGTLFGLGLAWSSMISPEVVLSFLQAKDFGLMLVMGGAVVVTLLTYQLLPRLRNQSLRGEAFQQREAHLDRNTLLGAAIFGIGWGLCGVCPGPAIAGLGAGNLDLLWALLGIFAGAYLQGYLHDL